MKPKGVREDDWRERDCLGCKKHIEGMYDKFIWDEPHNKWHIVTHLDGWLCPDCYPIFKNLISVIKKQIKKDFQDARADMSFRFKDSVKNCGVKLGVYNRW